MSHESKVERLIPFAGSRRFWQVFGIALAVVIAGLVLYVAGADVRAASDANQGLDCLSCHSNKPLSFHDKLGQGNKLCYTCHDGVDMKSLRLADGTLVPRSQSPQLCGQCHQKRYTAWQEGTHGIPGTVAGVTCTQCHDPHRPQMALLGITKPHPEPAPPPPEPPFDVLMIAGISVLFLTGVAVIAAKQGKRP